jgi:hypothetical protein
VCVAEIARFRQKEEADVAEAWGKWAEKAYGISERGGVLGRKSESERGDP